MWEDARQVNFLPGHPISYTTTKMEMFFNETFLASATGFVVKFAGKYALVTNWHVVSGRSPIDESCLSSHGGVPNRAKFHVTVSQPGPSGEDKEESLFFKPIELKLFHDDDMLQPVWSDERSTHAQSDYCIILLDPLVPELKNKKIRLRSIECGKIVVKNKDAQEERRSKINPEDIRNFYPPVGYQVFIVGYPTGINYNSVFPIWKGGFIASEPTVAINLNGHETRDAFFLDGLTRSGMSGSPVICLQKVGDTFNVEDGGWVKISKEEPLLVGVYAGREGVTRIEADLGCEPNQAVAGSAVL